MTGGVGGGGWGVVLGWGCEARQWDQNSTGPNHFNGKGERDDDGGCSDDDDGYDDGGCAPYKADRIQFRGNIKFFRTRKSDRHRTIAIVDCNYRST